MTEAFALLQYDANAVQCLPLRLVDGHDKAGSEWKLNPGPFHCRFVLLLAASSVGECASVQVEFLAGSWSIDVFAFDDVVADYFRDLHPCSVA